MVRTQRNTRVFALYDDFRPVLKTDNRSLTSRRADLAILRIMAFGDHTVHAIESRGGTIDLLQPEVMAAPKAVAARRILRRVGR